MAIAVELLTDKLIVKPDGRSAMVGRFRADTRKSGVDVLAVGLSPEATKDLIQRAATKGLTPEQQLREDLKSAAEW